MNDAITYVQQLTITSTGEKKERQDLNQKIQQHLQEKYSEIKAKTDSVYGLSRPASLKRHSRPQSPCNGVNGETSTKTTEHSSKQRRCSRWVDDDECSGETIDEANKNKNGMISSDEEDLESFSEDGECRNTCNQTDTKTTTTTTMQTTTSSTRHAEVYDYQGQNQRQNNSEQMSTSAPIFVLHPTGTHYVPMIIDSSLVSHAFEPQFSQMQAKVNKKRLQQENEKELQGKQRDEPFQLLCHPITIPVNFRRCEEFPNVYDTQNINVIGYRHQTSVEPK